jgi:Zn-finger protein
MNSIYIGDSSLDDRSAQVFPYNIFTYCSICRVDCKFARNKIKKCLQSLLVHSANGVKNVCKKLLTYVVEGDEKFRANKFHRQIFRTAINLLLKIQLFP